jgi:two-component system sensor histidine kinase DctS
MSSGSYFAAHPMRRPEHSPSAALSAELASIAERLRASEQRLALALESGRLGIWDWTVGTGKVVHTRSSQGDLPSYEESEATDWEAEVHRDDLERVRELQRHVLETSPEQYTAVVRQRLRDSDGHRYIEVRGKTVDRAPDGRLLRMVGTYEDVTDRLHRERQLKRHEAAVADTGRMVLIGEIASGLAHELNQPLGALAGYIGAAQRMLIADGSVRAEVLEALHQCGHLAEKVAEIVRRHRRMVQRKAPLAERFDANALVREVITLLDADAQAHDVSLATRFEAPDCPVVADRIQIEQVIINLVRNGVEALRDRGGPTRVVTIGTRRTGTAVEIRVTDNGPGIDERARDRVFHPFFSTKDAGSGLGLPICRHIAEAHHGSLRLEEAGPGRTTFVLELPSTHAHERHDLLHSR